MDFTDALKEMIRRVPANERADVFAATETPIGAAAAAAENDGGEKGLAKATTAAVAEAEAGVSNIAATQSVWGKKGFYLVCIGLAMIMTLFNYSTSDFNNLSALGTLNTATVIIFAVAKPPIAKISNVIGRGQTLAMTVCFYLLAYILMASAKSIGPYAGGMVFYNIGQSGMNVMTHIIVADITSPRWRSFGLAICYFPFLITPWVSALIVNSVVSDGGIGWRWGIGMFAFLMPFGASFIIGTLLWYQRKARKLGILHTQTITLYGFCSEIDLGGMLLFIAGFACFLLPLTIAAQEKNGWRTGWIIALIIIGAFLLICLPYYETYYSRHPIIPMFYLKNATIILSCLLVMTDSIGFSATHTYLYDWGAVAHNFRPTVDTYYVYTNGVIQSLVGIFAGLYMYWARRYKWLIMSGTVLRLIGYGVMIRLRGAHNSLAELFIVQVIQGAGSGIIQTAPLVAPQLVIPHSQVAQMIAVVWTFSYLGSSLGSTIAGAIYTNTMRERLIARLGSDASSALVDSLYNSITGTLPTWGSADRIAINLAYSDVIRYITYSALGMSIPAIIFTWFLPNLEIPDVLMGGVDGQHAEDSPSEERRTLRK
ncbi:siderochrome-iron transporter [Grosmannia clavigera kw1407]|uniref:Siderochrome-iron transporter n=1 Tax=Grosmannia clavigera (strain kw1407 / UAMH 11150) TaxID=655863 RepID=F0XLA0_GROCL|nr:siderochrome-iron transporter [Grosmannia clavigera kw1407]EFX01082.1 siderochrome-iron transporter [Grosmannia clavigera kw1407]